MSDVETRGRKSVAHRAFDASKVVGNRIHSRVKFWRAAFERLSPSQYVEKYIRLPPGKTETKSGPIEFSMSPFLREIVDAADIPGIVDVIFIAPTRLGKTFTLRMWFAWFVAGKPSPTNLYDSTIDKARSLSRKEIQPLIEYNPVLRAKKPLNRHHFTDTQMMFDGAPVQFYGGNSVSGAAGDTVVNILGNEFGKWNGESKEEASMVELVRHRTESHEDDRRHFFSSTPSTETGTAWVEYLKGDRRKWYVPCPCCGQLQQLVWEQVRFDKPGCKHDDGRWNLDMVRKTARYACINDLCGEEWDDKMRLAAIRNEAGGAKWIPTVVAEVPGYRTYHINGLYGSLKVNRIGELAVAFLNSRGTGFNTDRRDFWNSRMGQPWLDRPVSFNETRMKESLMPFKRGELPEGWVPDIIIIGFDVQSYGLPWAVLAYKWNGEVRTIDHGLAGTWEDLDTVQRNYSSKAGRCMVIGDIRYPERRPEVLREIFRRTQDGWKGAEGYEFSARPVKLGSVNPFLGTGKQGAQAAVPVLGISTYDMKVEWEKRFSREIPVWGIYTADTDDGKKEQAEHFTQLLDERRVKRERRLQGQPEWEWKSRNANNHALDCYVYSLSLFWLLRQARAAVEKDGANRPVENARKPALTIRR